MDGKNYLRKALAYLSIFPQNLVFFEHSFEPLPKSYNSPLKLPNPRYIPVQFYNFITAIVAKVYYNICESIKRRKE